MQLCFDLPNHACDTSRVDLQTEKIVNPKSTLLTAYNTSKASISENEVKGASILDLKDPKTGSSESCEGLLQHLVKYPYQIEKDLEDSLCHHCPAYVPVGYPVDLEPLWLHAVSYSGNNWSFECPVPDWAV